MCCGSARMSIAAGFLADVYRAAQPGEDGIEISDYRLDAFGLRAQAEEILFELQIEGQGTGQLEGKPRIVGVGQVLPRAGEGKNVAMELDRVRHFFLSGLVGIIFEEKHVGTQEVAFLIHLQNFKALSAFGNDIHAAVVIFFCHRNNFRCATDSGDSVFLRQHNAELPLLGQAFSDHFLVARLENMQRQRHAGEEYDFQREQGDERTHKTSELDQGASVRRQVRLYASA